MGKSFTLKENRDFLRLYRRGKCLVAPSIVTYVLKNKCGKTRYGITTSKKIGKAVQRNRARRVIRAAWFDLYSSIVPGYDVVFVARGKTPYVKSDVLKREIESHLKKAGIFSIK
ncbi:MAG: ribonuclease P protein component [Ruminococcus sp.]|nr:ribonuclease P protein component [Ruminococcus sp.]